MNTRTNRSLFIVYDSLCGSNYGSNYAYRNRFDNCFLIDFLNSVRINSISVNTWIKEHYFPENEESRPKKRYELYMRQ